MNEWVRNIAMGNGCSSCINKNAIYARKKKKRFLLISSKPRRSWARLWFDSSLLFKPDNACVAVSDCIVRSKGPEKRIDMESTIDTHLCFSFFLRVEFFFAQKIWRKWQDQKPIGLWRDENRRIFLVSAIFPVHVGEPFGRRKNVTCFLHSKYCFHKNLVSAV